MCRRSIASASWERAELPVQRKRTRRNERLPVTGGWQRRARWLLSRIDELQVAAHTSSFSFKGKDVKIAMTFPGGTHDLWIRYWLAAGGIDPDKDIETITVPPPQMVANMKVGTMDCFCVGEPWNLQLINQKIGYTAITTGELWNKHPEKSFGLRAAWVDPAGGDLVPRLVREIPGSAGKTPL